MAEKPNTLLFLDIETTGLKPAAKLLELAAILVRAHDLEVVSRFQGLVQIYSAISDDSVWDPFVVAMHSKNGLIAEIADPKKGAFRTTKALFTAFAAWLHSVGQPTKRCYIAGSSVHTDIEKLKSLDVEEGYSQVCWDGFSHRLVDLSSLRTFDTLAGAKLFPDKKPDNNHRAMGDCEQDLSQLRAAMKSARVESRTTIIHTNLGPVTQVIEAPLDRPR